MPKSVLPAQRTSILNAPYEWSTVSVPADRGALLKNELAEFESIKDPITAYEMVSSGHFGHLFGQNIIISKFVSPNEMYILGEPQYGGYMPTRQDFVFNILNDVTVPPAHSTIQYEDDDGSYDDDFSW